MNIQKPYKHYKIFDFLNNLDNTIHSRLPFLMIVKKYIFYGAVSDFEAVIETPHRYYESTFYKNEFTITAKYSLGVGHADGGYADRIKIDGNYYAKDDNQVAVALKYKPSSTSLVFTFAGIILILAGINVGQNLLTYFGLLAPFPPLGILYIQRRILTNKFVSALRLTREQKKRM